MKSITYNIAYNIDCMELMANCNDKDFDLAIVDPPYGLGESLKAATRTRKPVRGLKGAPKVETNYEIKEWDFQKPSAEYFQELFRVSKHQIVFGGQHFTHMLPQSQGWILWDKVNGEIKFGDCEMIWTSFSQANRLIRFMWNGMFQGRSLKRGLVAQGDKRKCEKRIHPSQKPVRIYEYLMCNFSNPGERILDTHLGSGSSRIAAYKNKREFVGCELDPDYFQDQEKRFNQFMETQKQKELW